jgi:lysyl endopeptidase
MVKNSFVGILIIILTLNSSLSQITDFGKPISFNGKITMPKNAHVFPVIDVAEEIQKEEQRKEVTKDKKLIFGVEHEVSINYLQQAVQTHIPNGGILYQYNILCPQAKSINLIFDLFELPEGARLYLASTDKSTYLGAYTSINNNQSKVLGTDLIYAENIIVELFEPKEVVGQSKLHISTVVHGYLNLNNIMKGLNDSGDCNIDVNCPLGQGWEKQRNATAHVVSGGGACSGSLVNNTTGTVIPYYLSANHCGTNPTNWVFRFRWETPSEDVVCAQTNPSTDGPTNMTVNGGVLRANNSGSDFVLVELNTAPDPTWDIYYNGWDRSEQPVFQGTGIHHPRGDIKKICRKEGAIAQITTPFFGNPNVSMWRIDSWTEGVTESGSSGSPLFDQNKRTIGVLSGGLAACVGTNNNGAYDEYGRFGVAWDQGSTPSTRLKDWLDPNGLGFTFIDGTNGIEAAKELDGAINGLAGVSGTFCGAEIFPQITIANTGTSILTSATINYGFNGDLSNSYNWTGSLSQYQSETIDLPMYVSTNGNQLFQAVLVNPNNQQDENLFNNSMHSSFNVILGGEIITLNLQLDCYGNENTWTLTDSNLAVLFSGGPYSATGGPLPPPIIQEFCLSSGCYEFRLMDSWGDGLSDSNCAGSGSFTISNENEEVIAEMLPSEASFGSVITKEICIENSASVKNFEVNKTSIQMYPNPAKNKVLVKSEAEILSLKLTNIIGQTIIEEEVSANEYIVNLRDVSKGVYLVKVVTKKETFVKQLIVE